MLRHECWWESEVFRLRGELLRAGSVDNADEVEVCYQQALDISRRQKAKFIRTASDNESRPVFGKNRIGRTMPTNY